MAVLRTEGFDWLETADLPSAYGFFNVFDTAAAGPTITIEEAGGRNGQKSCKIAVAAGSAESHAVQGISLPIGNVIPATEVIVGFAVKFTQLNPTISTTFFQIKNGIGTNQRSSSDCILQRTISGTITVGWTNTTDGAFLLYAGATGTNVLAIAEWYYIEIKFKGNSSTGTVEVHVNGAADIAVTGLNTAIHNDDNYVSAVFGCNDPSTTLAIVEYDDIYIMDTTGSINTDFLGDVEILRLAPDGNGNTSDFVGSDANSVDNWLHVDDAGAPDDDTSYVEDSVSGNKDLYTYEDVPASTTEIKAIGVKTLGKKTETASASMLAVARSNVTETDSATLGFTQDIYLTREAVFEVDPDTGVAWTPSGVNAAEFGVKVE